MTMEEFIERYPGLAGMEEFRTAASTAVPPDDPTTPHILRLMAERCGTQEVVADLIVRAYDILGYRRYTE